MNPIIRTTVLALSVLGLAITPVAEAAKPVKVKRARFAVTVDGVQNTSWSIDHKAAGIGGCDGAYTGQGTEKVRFTSEAFTHPRHEHPRAARPGADHGDGVEHALAGVQAPRKHHAQRREHRRAGPGQRLRWRRQAPADPRTAARRSSPGWAPSFDYKLASRVRDTLDVGTFNGKDPFGNCGGGGTSSR